jgi:hypothetical protein
MPRARLPFWGKVILGCLTLWALVVILPDFARVFDQDFNNKLPFEADNNGELTEVEPSSPLAGCQRIDLPRNYCEGRMADLMAVFGGMGGMQYVWHDLKSVTLYVRCTGPQPAPQSAPPAAQPYAPLRFFCARLDERSAAPSQLRTVATKVEPLDLLARFTLLLAQLSAVLFIALAFGLVWSRPSAATWGFFLYAIWFNPGQYYVFYAWLQHWSSTALLGQEVAQAAFQAIGYCGFVLFALRFPQNEIAPQWHRLEQALPLIGGLVLFVQLYAFLPVFGVRAEWAADATFIAGVLIDALVLAVLFIRYRRQSHENRHRLRYVFWCSVFGLAAFIVAEIDVATTLVDVRIPDAVLYLLYTLNASVALAVWHAVRKYRVVDVKFTLSRHAIKAVLWLLVAVPLLWLTQITDAYSESMVKQYVDHPDIFINVLILLVAAAPMKYGVDAVQEHAVTLFDSIFFRKLQQAEKTLEEVADELAHADDTLSAARIEDGLIAMPAAALDLASAALFRLHNGAYRRTCARDWPADAVAALPAQHAVIRQLDSGRRASLRFDPSELPPDLPGGAAAPALAVPVRSAGRIEAVVFYGGHRGGDDLNDDELRLLEKLAAAASIAYATLELIALRKQIGPLRGDLQDVPAS